MYRNYDVDYDTFYPMISLPDVISACIYPFANYLVAVRFNEKSRPPLIIGGIIGITLIFSSVAIKFGPIVFIIVYSLGTGMLKGFNK